MPSDNVHIRFEASTADATSARFIVDRSVYPGGPYLYDSPAGAAGSPLPTALLALAGVRSVLVADNVLTLTVQPGTVWKDLAPHVGRTVRTQLQSGTAPLDPRHAGHSKDPAADATIAQVVEKVLAEQVNPGIAAHSGKILLDRVEDTVVYLRLTGGCQGCAASSVTLTQGVERLLRKAAPQVTRIVDVTDHTAGDTPYYVSSLSGAARPLPRSPLQILNK